MKLPAWNWREIILSYTWITIGAMIEAISTIIFLAPFEVAPGGVVGIAVILNLTIGTPVGLLTFLMNIPIQMIAYRMLPGGWRIIIRTVYAIIMYTLFMDILNSVVRQPIAGENALLNTLFGGVLAGIGGGLIFRAGGSLGGTSTLALILQRRLSTPMSTTYLYTDALVIGVAGIVFGWEAALYAIVALFLTGTATDYVLEGPSIIRTCVIITDKPEEVAKAIMSTLYRGVTAWDAIGMYTQQTHTMLYVTVSRTQVQEVRRLVMQIDSNAFIVVAQGHTAYGRGFKQLTGE
jgi:uncharacterized membrane-anchored protein YitT (DUF2179 family)